MLLVSWRQFATLLFFAVISSSAFLRAADVKSEDVVARHLDSIGTAQARKDLKSRVVEGSCTYRVIVGGSGAVDGKFVLATAGRKANFLFKVNTNDFRGEQFISDGSKTSEAGTYNDKTRSEFGYFVYSQDAPLRENLLGGVWSAGWPLLDLDARKGKVHYEGSKKVDGKELIALRYEPKKSTDLDIVLYFDPQTYQHVMTIYKMERSNSLAGGETAQAGKQPRRYEIEERFSDFKTADGLTLPTHYDLRYTLETETGFKKTIEWEVKALGIHNNIGIDDHSFQVQ